MGDKNRPIPLSALNIDKFIEKYDHLLLDCDGVLWSRDQVTKIPGIADAVNKLRDRNKSLYFITNGTIHARSAYLGRFQKMAGFDATLDAVFPVTYAAGVFAKDVLRLSRKVYAIGTDGLKEDLELAGFTVLGVGPDTDPVSYDPKVLTKYQLDPEVDAVVIGFDSHFGYNKLFKAASYLKNTNCHFIATSDLECSVPVDDNYTQPIVGSLVAAVSAASNRRPVVVGKPSDNLFQCLLSKHGLDPQRTVMVGDSLKTDIAFAGSVGIDSLLVLTGTSQPQDISKSDIEHKPTYILESFADLANLL